MARVLGIDPGFASLGFALADVHGNGVAGLDVVTLGVVRTEKSDAKRAVLAADDNLRRARELTRVLTPLFEGVQVVCAESMSFPRNSSAAAKVAMCWGVVASLAEQRDIPIVQVSPKELKKTVCGDAAASKEMVQKALDGLLGRVFSTELLGNGVPAGLHEHAYDALGTIVAARNSEVLRLIRRLS